MRSFNATNIAAHHCTNHELCHHADDVTPDANQMRAFDATNIAAAAASAADAAVGNAAAAAAGSGPNLLRPCIIGSISDANNLFRAMQEGRMRTEVASKYGRMGMVGSAGAGMSESSGPINRNGQRTVCTVTVCTVLVLLYTFARRW
jgi:hypothetical protein